MAEWQLIETRLISGSGVLKVPDISKKFRATILYCDLVRPPTSPFLNRNWNPPRGKYAFLTFVRNQYVISDASMDYDRQSYDGIQDIAGQTLIAVKCAYDGILQTFVNLSIALAATPGGVGLQPISKVDLIKDYENLANSWQEVRIKCYADTAIQARLYSLKYDSCTADRDDEKPPPPPPPPPARIPAGTPINNISSPYDPFTDDGGNTQPAPIDDEGGEPTDCTNVIIYFRYTRVLDGASSTQQFNVAGRAPVVDAYIDEVVSGGSSIFVVDKGAGSTCPPTTSARRVNRGLGTWSNLQYYVVPV
jgi:hypothetical protein